MKRIIFRTGYILGITLVIIGFLFLSFYLWINFYHYDLQVHYMGNPLKLDTILNRSSIEDLTSGNQESPETILLVTLDTLRADHLTPYGYPAPTSPFLEKFANENVKFNRGFSAMSTTTPSHATILSSLYPLQHRALKNGQRMKLNVRTLPEMLRDEGYRTAAFVSTNRHFNESHVAQGFDVYRSPDRAEQIVRTSMMTERRNISYRPAKKTFQDYQEWIKKIPSDENIFVWIHYFDPHYKYVPRKNYLKKSEPDSLEKIKDWIRFIKEDRYFEILPEVDNLNKRSLKSVSVEYLKNSDRFQAYRLYDSEIRYTDFYVGEAVEQTENRSDDGSMIMIVGDHGEGMGNHNWWGHGREIYNEQIRIPLMMKFPNGRYRGRVVEEVVETNDLLPTVLQAVSPSPDTVKKRSFPIEGTPLQSLLEGNKEEFGYAFTQRRQYNALSWSKRLKIFFWGHYYNPVNFPFEGRAALNYEIGSKYSLIGQEFKYIYSTRHRDEIFNMGSDFYEQENLVDASPESSRKLGVSLKNLVDHLRRNYSDETVTVDQDTQKKLEALGYVN